MTGKRWDSTESDPRFKSESDPRLCSFLTLVSLVAQPTLAPIGPSATPRRGSDAATHHTVAGVPSSTVT